MVPAIPPPLLTRANAEAGWRRPPAASRIAMHNLSRLHFFAVAGGAERVGNSLYAGKSLEKYVTAGLSFDRGLPDTSKILRRAAFLHGCCPGWARAALRQKVAA